MRLSTGFVNGVTTLFVPNISLDHDNNVGGTKMYSSPYFVPLSFFTPEVYKLYQCAMPFTAESKNLILLIQNLQFLGINILAKT